MQHRQTDPIPPPTPRRACPCTHARAQAHTHTKGEVKEGGWGKNLSSGIVSAGKAGHEEAGQHSRQSCDLQLQSDVRPTVQVVEAGPVRLREGLHHHQDEEWDDAADASPCVQLHQQAPEPACITCNASHIKSQEH